MDSEYYAAITSAIAAARKNCKMCNTYKHINHDRGERSKAHLAVKELIKIFNDLYNHLRREDASVSSIQNAIGNKRLCMDLDEACLHCTKDVDQINRGFIDIRLK